MGSAIVVFKSTDPDLPAILVKKAKELDEGWAFAALHPRMLSLMMRIQEIGHGELNISIRDGLPEDGLTTKAVRF